MHRRAACLALALASIGCGPSSESTTPTRGGTPVPGCDLTLEGPVVGYSYVPSPPPAATGGPLADGTYDLVQIVKHTATPGQWSSNMAPAFRWVMRFTTRERSSNHVSGEMTAAVEIPPAAQCERGRFAILQNEIRTEGGSKGISSMLYTATGDQLVLLEMKGDGGVPHAYVFRRRR